MKLSKAQLEQRKEQFVRELAKLPMRQLEILAKKVGLL